MVYREIGLARSSSRNFCIQEEEKWWESIGIKCDNVRIVELTPGLAREWLKRNGGNRHLRDVVVGRYCGDIINDRWQVNGEPIIFDQDGFMRSGQHRCTAVIKADKSIIVYVVFDVDRDSFMTMDSGAKRSSGDQLGILGEKQSVVIGAAVGLLLKYERLFSGRLQFTNVEIIEAWKQNPGISKHAATAVALSKLAPKSVICMASYCTSLIDADLHSRFWESVKSGEGLIKGSPILALRNKLISLTSGRGLEKQETYLYCVIQAWNAERRNRSISSIPIPSKIAEFPQFV